jgi:hypothetical protein
VRGRLALSGELYKRAIRSNACDCISAPETNLEKLVQFGVVWILHPELLTVWMEVSCGVCDIDEPTILGDS